MRVNSIKKCKNAPSPMVFFKERFLLDFFSSKSKNRFLNLLFSYCKLSFSQIIENIFRITYSNEIRTKLFRLLIFQRRLILTNYIMISVLILEKGYFLWNQNSFKVVSFLFYLKPPLSCVGFKRRWGFRKKKVSMPKNDKILAKIHHMLGFTCTPVFKFSSPCLSDIVVTVYP